MDQKSSPPPEQDPLQSREMKRLRALSRVLDSAIPLPGGFRIGLDGIIGLIPGVGDAAGASLSAYVVVQAARLGASPLTLLRMMLNVLVETVIGAIPILGDIFDFAWKANNRNVALLEAQMGRGVVRGNAKRRLTIAVIILLAAFLLLLVGVIVLAFKVLFALAEALGG